jgi:pyruvoyl-dependent arginine decarboxylase (PvlArgDC)
VAIWRVWSWVPPDGEKRGFWYEHVSSKHREDAELFATTYRNRFDGTKDTVRVSSDKPIGEPQVFS